MGNKKKLTGSAILQLIAIGIVLWVAFTVGAVVIQIALGLLALGGIAYLLWNVFFAKK